MSTKTCERCEGTMILRSIPVYGDPRLGIADEWIECEICGHRQARGAACVLRNEVAPRARPDCEISEIMMNPSPTPRELEFVKEVKEVLDMLVQGVHITAHHLNPAQGYVLTCVGGQGDHVTVNHYGFGGTSGPWTPELASASSREQCILLGGEQ